MKLLDDGTHVIAMSHQPRVDVVNMARQDALDNLDGDQLFAKLLVFGRALGSIFED